ncbi:MAG: D-2-hydroxyacid dehydrogenase [Mariniblastus sp.]|nr:D-2-hydroxyacid dehydrogenase [Mariniblastus sp.]
MPSDTIVTCFPLSESDANSIRTAAPDNFDVIVANQENISEEIFKASVFCGHAKVPVDWDRVVANGKLKWIQSSAAGLDHCLVPPVIESKILVSGCSGLFAPQVGEQMMSLLTGLIRRSPVFFKAQQAKQFIRRPTDNLFGKTVGIAGLGGNGQRIAQILRPMVSRILATDCFVESVKDLVDQGVVDKILPAESLEEMLPEIDILIITLPLSATNENRIGKKQFDLLRPGAYVVNVGRGSVIETKSMVDSLSSGRLGGAGIDVVEPEPLPESSPLWGMDNVIISPHVGAQSPLRIPVTIDLFCQNINRFLEGMPLLNQVDKTLGFPLPEHRIHFKW